MSSPSHRRAARAVRASRPRPRVRLNARARAAGTPPPHPRVRPWRAYAVAVTIVLLVVAGLLLYLDERSSRGNSQTVGTAPGPDRVTVHVVLQRVDAAAQTLVAKVLVQPEGALAREENLLVPAQDVEVGTTSLEQRTLRYPAGQQIAAGTVSFDLFDGRVSDYPFDRYHAAIGFRATAGGRVVPVVIEIEEADPFFAFRRGPGADEPGEGVVAVTERISRSRSTFILAWFMIAAMWALALSVLVAAWLIVRQRRGLVWPALSWMAATLFALVGMRNAAPGSPPIGSLLDYAAFFWAELLVAVGLTMVVVRGTRVEGGHRS